jgi:hypothetical protein
MNGYTTLPDIWIVLTQTNNLVPARTCSAGVHYYHSHDEAQTRVEELQETGHYDLVWHEQLISR